MTPMKNRLMLLWLLLPVSSLAQLTYPISAIADSMKKNAIAVLRIDEAELKIVSPSKYYFKAHKVVTLLSEAAEDELSHVYLYDKFSKYDDIKITIYNKDGMAVKTYNKKDFTSRAYDDDISIVTDSKIMYLQTAAPGYPCTVEVTTEEIATSYIELPDWYILSPKEAVELSKYTVIVPADIDIRYRSRGIQLKPVITTEGNNKKYYWELRNLTAKEQEEGSLRNYETFPKIEIGPNKFEYDDYKGDMNSWAAFGNWNYPFYESANPFDDKRKAEITALLAGAATEKEKIGRLYSYMQSNLRYVSVQLGIGGFKPFQVDFVDQKKYGDCKALSNYMRNLLKIAGIKSYPALVNAGKRSEPADPAFPGSPFNHVILCAITSTDTVWLECTSNTDEVGKLGTFTENRNALLLTEEGGKLVATPKSKASENTFGGTTTVTLNEDGSGKTSTSFITTGSYLQDFMYNFGEGKKDEQKKYIVQRLGFVQPDDFEVLYDKKNKFAPTTLSMMVEKIPEFSAGSKHFLSPRIYKIWSHALPSAEQRKNDYILEVPFIKTDTTIYQLPDGYGVDNLPKPRDIKFDYGSFKTNYTFDAARKAVISTARLELKQHVIPAAKFMAAKMFFNEVIEEFTEKIVVKRM
jgi:Domain of Unknown Function with PDB structure (DUF3857)